MGWKFSLAGLTAFAAYKSALYQSRQDATPVIVILLAIIVLIAFFSGGKKK